MTETRTRPLPAPEAAAPVPAANSTLRNLWHHFVHLGMVWVLVVVVVAAQIVYPGFLAPRNIGFIISQNAPTGIIAVGMTMVMIAGGFDLSVGAIYAAGAVIFADMANHMPLPLALVVAILLGAVLGLINGLLVTKVKINAFIATLGTASVFGGATYFYTNSGPVNVYVDNFDILGLGRTLGLANATWILAIAFVLGALTLSRTVFGRSLYVVGGNPEAARLAGMQVDRLKAATFVIVGVCAALSGAIIASRVGVGQAEIAGSMSLDVIAVVVIGGTSLFGGEGSMWRTAVGLLIVACLGNVCDSLGLDSNSQSIIKGGIILGAVALDAVSRRKRR
ncbi:MAG: ABC transporter permease [Bauldia sp.]|nr:ABC transporter permease [Bauldia sp.]